MVILDMAGSFDKPTNDVMEYCKDLCKEVVCETPIDRYINGVDNNILNWVEYLASLDKYNNSSEFRLEYGAPTKPEQELKIDDDMFKSWVKEAEETLSKINK